MISMSNMTTANGIKQQTVVLVRKEREQQETCMGFDRAVVL
jgi:hypothetical protein